MSLQPAFYLTTRFTEAVDYAREHHRGQTRKGTRIPYLHHLLGVASLVLEYEGDEDLTIAALLHDLIEDCGIAHETAVRERFGARVADIVLACTDATEEAKAALTTKEEKRAGWRRRKLEYLAHLQVASEDALLVSCCDKLHNARAIVSDLEDPAVGDAVFDRFTAGREGTLAYYHSIGEVYTHREIRAAPALERAVHRMHELTQVSVRKPLV